MNQPTNTRATQRQEDLMLVHAKIHGFKRRATVAQVAFDKGMEIMEAQLPDNWEAMAKELKEEGGWK